MSAYMEETETPLSYAKDTVKGVYDSGLIINSRDFDYVVTKLRLFFKSKGFLEASSAKSFKYSCGM